MNKNITSFVIPLLLTILIITGGFFRLRGITTNHSFWSDEAFTGSIARDIVTGKMGFLDGLNLLKYEPLQIAELASSFRLFEASESSARILSVMWGTIGIFFSYLLAKRFSNTYGGLLAAFLCTFLQLNLANSTQAKPYTALQTLLLAGLYLVTLLKQSKSPLKLHLAIITISTLATLLHNLGVIVWIPYLVYLLLSFINKSDKKKNLLWPIMASAFIVLFFGKYLPLLFTPRYNNANYFINIFIRQYGFLTMPALLGLILIPDKKYFWGISAIFLFIFYSWNFLVANHEIRYLVPIFGLLVVLFGVFWGRVGETIFKRPAIVCLLVAALVYFSGYKIVQRPLSYYTPNADFAGDIQNADYKSFFSEWRQKYPDFEEYPILAGPFDSLSWYTQRYPTATFNRFNKSPIYYPQYGFTEYTNLEEFVVEMSKYPQGFVMIHDWISYMPDEIKDYVKKNLKSELRIESMAVSPDDKWPLVLYSWGF